MPRNLMLKPRRATLAEWAAAEAGGPALEDGELAYVKDEKSWVVGDGVTKVALLPRSGQTAAALAQDPALTGAFAPVGGLSAQYPMRRLGYVAAQQQNGDTKHVRWLTFGSSVGDLKIREVGPLIAAQYGGRQAGAIMGTWSATSGPAIGGVGVSTVTVNSTTGTVTDSTDDYDVWVAGQATRMTTTGSRTYGIGGGSFTCDTIEIYYTKGPASSTDGGTFSYQVDAGATTNVDTSSGAATLGIGRTVINPARAAHTPHPRLGERERADPRGGVLRLDGQRFPADQRVPRWPDLRQRH